MARDGPMATPTELLTLTQWLSPAYPVGAFAYSHGLESAIREGLVGDGAALEDWLAAVLEHGTGRTDAILIALAHASEDLPRLDAIARAYAGSRERLIETVDQGTAFGKVTGAIWGGTLPGCYPVALGAAAGREGLPLALTQALYLQSVLSNLTAAAQRLMPLGQTGAQGILRRLTPRIPPLLARIEGAGEDDLSSSAFLPDIAALRHETLQPRIFRT